MDAQVNGDFLRAFGDLADPRRDNRRFLLCDVLLLAVAAVMCGCDGWQDIEDWTEDAFVFLRPLLVKPEHGSPSADTYRRVFARLSPEGFERCFAAWTQTLKQGAADTVQDPLIAIDGKTLRHSYAHGWNKTPLHMVSAYACANGLVLGQLKVESKANEIVAIPKLLELLNLKRATVSIDAMGCQKDIAQKIIDGKGHYVLAVKENQPALYEATKKLLDEAILEGFKNLRHDYHEQITGDHGRIETRRVWVCDAIQWLKMADQWPGLRQVAVVERRREMAGQSSTQRGYFIASHPTLDAARTAGAIRGHWGIENQVHWVLDMVFQEDQSRIRRDDGGENFSRLRRMALNKLRTFQDPSGKKPSLRMKRKKCGWSFDYFLKALAA